MHNSLDRIIKKSEPAEPVFLSPKPARGLYARSLKPLTVVFGVPLKWVILNARALKSPLNDYPVKPAPNGNGTILADPFNAETAGSGGDKP